MEILAPCGSPGHIKAAVYAGADAVYLGGRGFSARRNAANFGVDELREAVAFCRGFGVKVYVTVNILTRDGEWDELKGYLTDLAGLAPDALIVQDIGVARFCRELLPDMPLHASTQMSIHSARGAKFCAEAGFERVVIARECDRDTLTEIIKTSGIGIEMFVHGALCVSVSGQCGLSAMIGGRSGNRGLCAQPCRLDFKGGTRDHVLSLKDLSLVREIPLLQKMGIKSLKIEGRMKRPEYVAAAVHACRAAVNGEEPDMETLQAVFSRSGFTQGYFYGRRFNMGGIRTASDAAESAAILPKLAELTRAPSRRVPVDISFEITSKCALTISDGEDSVTLHGPTPEEARETTGEHVTKLLSRLGDTPFALREIHLNIIPGLSVPPSVINGMRRAACGELLQRRIELLTPHYEISHSARRHIKKPPVQEKPPLRVHCETLEQARSAEGTQVVLGLAEAEKMPEGGLKKVLIEPDRFVADEKELTRRLAVLKSKGAEHLLCQNPAHAAIGRELGYTLHGGAGLNVFNSRAVDFWVEYGLQSVTASVELKLSEALALNALIPVGVVVYGQLPLLLLRRCPFERACESGKCPGFLSDRTGRRFPVRCKGAYQEVLNADVLWMADKIEALRGAGFLTLLLNGENTARTEELVKAYKNGADAPKKFTRGLLMRGVE